MKEDFYLGSFATFHNCSKIAINVLTVVSSLIKITLIGSSYCKISMVCFPKIVIAFGVVDSKNLIVNNG